MSGSKRGYIRQTPVSRVAAARVNLEVAIAACSSPQGNGLQEVIADAEKWLSSLRRETAEWRNPRSAQSPAAPSAATVQKLERMREDFALSVAGEQRTCESLAQAQMAARSAMEAAQQSVKSRGATAAHLASVEAALGKAMGEVDRVRRLADQAKRRIERQRAEFEGFYSHAKSKPSAPTSAMPHAEAKSQDGTADAAAMAAAKSKLSEQLEAVSREPQAGWGELRTWVGGERPFEEWHGLLRSAAKLLSEGDVAATEVLIEKAIRGREELERTAHANRGDIERIRSVADAVMQALCDRHYDTPIFGPLREGDPLSGIQIRADVPSPDGRGNIRIELHADGRADFEVENVPAGEEETCRAIIEGLADAAASEGMELGVTDWGRARGERGEQVRQNKKTEQVRERMRRGRDARPDEHEGEA